MTLVQVESPNPTSQFQGDIGSQLLLWWCSAIRLARRCAISLSLWTSDSRRPRSLETAEVGSWPATPSGSSPTGPTDCLGPSPSFERRAPSPPDALAWVYQPASWKRGRQIRASASLLQLVSVFVGLCRRNTPTPPHWWPWLGEARPADPHPGKGSNSPRALRVG